MRKIIFLTLSVLFVMHSCVAQSNAQEENVTIAFEYTGLKDVIFIVKCNGVGVHMFKNTGTRAENFTMIVTKSRLSFVLIAISKSTDKSAPYVSAPYVKDMTTASLKPPEGFEITTKKLLAIKKIVVY